MRPLLVVFNPRRIDVCMAAFSALNVDKAYLTGYTETGLVPVISDLVRETDYTHYVAISDDAVVPQRALDAVLDGLRHDCYPVVTGWSNLDGTEARVNLTRTPLKGEVPSVESYDMFHWSEVLGHPDAYFRSWFAGMCLTGMPRELWERYPFDCYGKPGPGFASDYYLCKRLEADGVPIMAARDGFVLHVKSEWSKPDAAPGRELRIGEDQGVRMEYGCQLFA